MSIDGVQGFLLYIYKKYIMLRNSLHQQNSPITDVEVEEDKLPPAALDSILCFS